MIQYIFNYFSRSDPYTENCQIEPSPSPVLIRRPAPRTTNTRSSRPSQSRRLLAVPPPKSPAIPETLPSSAATRPLRRLRRAPAIQVSPDSSHRAEFRPGNGLPGGRWPRRRGFSFLSFTSRSYLAYFFCWVGVWIDIAWVMRSDFFLTVVLDPGPPGDGFGAGGLSSSGDRFCEAFDGFGRRRPRLGGHGGEEAAEEAAGDGVQRLRGRRVLHLHAAEC